MSMYTNPEAAGYLLEAEACGAVIKEVDRLIEKFQRKINREAEKRKQELETALGYRSEQDIQDAYGWEFITEKQYDRYIDLFRQGQAALENHTPTRAELALSILRRFRWALTSDQNEWELSALTPEQRAAELERRAKAAQEWKDRLRQMKSYEEETTLRRDSVDAGAAEAEKHLIDT